MKRFAQLFTQLDQTTKTNDKVAALKLYFDEAGEEDKLWTIALLSGKRPRRTVTTTDLREWAAGVAELPPWLFEESYHVVGDLAETIALVLPPPKEEATQESSLKHYIQLLRELKKTKDDREKQEAIVSVWRSLSQVERFVFNKLITGGFRMGVSQKLMVRALSQSTGIDENTLAHRIMGNWQPDEVTFDELVLEGSELEDASKPYPFYLAYPLEEEPESLGAPADWLAERKWDGIRGQLIVRKGELFVWSRGEELVTDKYPEYEPLKYLLPDGTVIDGEILPFKDGRPMNFQHLQTRIGRKNVTRKYLEEVPVILMAYDLLEYRGDDIREQPIEQRRALLEEVCAEALQQTSVLQLSEIVHFNNWDELKQERDRSREYHSEGIMLKHKASTYKVGRKKGDWWKWKVDPLTVDAVLTYAMRGHGRRANLYTDYTFAVWKGDELITFTKAYSGLTNEEIQEVDRFVKRHTLERFGPVMQVEPELVFEIAFEGIAPSNRHKSGVALRFPRIHRWRKDKKIEEANTLQDLEKLVEQYGQ